MKRILNAIKEKEVDVLILLIILVTQSTIFRLVAASDEIWNFANCYKMFNGYRIYQDLNVIITPLFFYISQIFFKILGPTILIFKVYNIVITTILLLLVYFIFKSLKIVRRRAIFYTVIIFLLFNEIIGCGANYNVLVMVPILISIILILNKKENPIAFGILLFSTFMLKQNVYIFYALGIMIYELIKENNIKEKIINLLKIYFVSLIGIGVFLSWLYINNNLYNFVNYCFLGISEFGSSNISFGVEDARMLYIAITSMIIAIVLICNKKTNKLLGNQVITNLKVLLAIGAPILLISYPIFNYYHATLASLIMLIQLIYIFEKIYVQNFNIKRKKEKIIYIIVIFLIIIYQYGAKIEIIVQNKDILVWSKSGVLYGGLIEKDAAEDIKIICDYIKKREKNNIDVKMLTHKANLYMINLNKNNEEFDLAFLGNLGIDGEEGLIKKIQKLESTLVLLQTNPEDVFWQESKRVREYILNNYQKIGEIQEYSIFAVNF